MKKFGVLLTIFVCVTALNSVVFAAEGDGSQADASAKAPEPKPASNPEGGGSFLGLTNGGQGEGSQKTDGAGVGLDAQYKAIQEAMKAATTTVAEASATVTLTTPNFKTMSAGLAKYASNRDNCISRQEKAAYACLENLSSNIQDAITAINPIAAMVGVATNDACSGFAQAMNVAKGAMTAYTAVCGTMKAGCGLSCVAARDGLTSIVNAAKKELGSVTCVPKSTAVNNCQKYLADYQNELNILIKNGTDDLTANAEKTSVADKAEVCTKKYAALGLSALAGIGSLAQSMAQGKKCDEESNGTSTAANTPTADLAEKCSKPENAQLPECLCMANPRLPGCANGLQKAGENSTIGSLSALSSPNANAANKNGLSGSDLMGGDAPAGDGRKVANDSSGSGAAGAPMGGSAGLSGSGGGGSGTGAPTGDANGKKGLDANILGGASGGGGGGGSWGMGSGSGSSDSKLRGYLPGGAQDPNKMAGQGNWTKEVTGQGGKSNWEKVRDRYRDNNPTLLNN